MLGAEHGCEFTAEDLAEKTELSDEELDEAAGGVGDARGVTTRELGAVPIAPGTHNIHITDMDSEMGFSTLPIKDLF